MEFYGIILTTFHSVCALTLLVL